MVFELSLKAVKKRKKYKFYAQLSRNFQSSCREKKKRYTDKTSINRFLQGQRELPTAENKNS